MRRRKFVVLLAADGQDLACQLFDLAVVCDVNRCNLLVEQLGNDFRNHFDLALVEVRDDFIAGFDRQLEQMTVCACSLLLYLGRLRYFAHFECDRRALRFSEYGFDRLLVERHLAVFGIHRQIGVGLVSYVLHEAHFQRKLYAVRALRVGLFDLQYDLGRLVLRCLLDDLVVMRRIDLDLGNRFLGTIGTRLFRHLDLCRRCGGG